MDFSKKFLEALSKGMINIYEKEKEAHPKILGKYHPSSIGDCLRKQYYEFYSEEKLNENQLAIFAIGKGIHKIIAEILRESKVINVEFEEFETNLEIEGKLLHGRADIIVANIEGEKIIVEIKSVSRIPKEAHEKHVLQLQSYLHALNIEKGIILYWDKRKGKREAFPIIKDEKALKVLKERITKLHEYILNKKEPPKEMALKEKYIECLNCEFKEICKPLKIEMEENEIIVCEIDNILVNTEKRKKLCLEKLNLKNETNLKSLDKETKEKFFELYYSKEFIQYDEPLQENIEKLIKEYMNNKRIIIVTNRPSKIKKETEEQLLNLGIPYEKIFMRDEFSKGINFKITILKLLKYSGYNIVEIMDENETVRKLKKKLENFIP